MQSHCSLLERWLAATAERMALSRSITSRRGFGHAVLVVFLLTQLTDAVFTWIGVGTHGFHAEANPMAASLMVTFGLAPAVAGLKLVTASLGFLLHALGVHRILALVAGAYLVAAVLPWAALLLVW